MFRHVSNIVFLIVAFVTLLVACQDDTFVGRGGEGVQRRPVHDQITETNGQNLAAKPPACNTLFIVSGRAAEGVVNCQNVNYQGIYQRAGQMAQVQLAELTCPQNCAPMQSVESARVWSCVRPNPNQPAIAAATVEKTALCPVQGGVTLPPPLGPLPAGALTAPQGNLSSLSMQPGLTEDFSPGSTVSCPGRRIIRLDHEDRSPNTCRRARFDFTAYVQRATSLAEEEWKTFACAQGCTKKQPFSHIKRQWRCNRRDPNDNLVDVRLWYGVECLRPQTGDSGSGSSGNGSGEEQDH
ncbi:MAG: hypothetical protein ACU826_04290 [Gammaproteobacteria bacterium]